MTVPGVNSASKSKLSAASLIELELNAVSPSESGLKSADPSESGWHAVRGCCLVAGVNGKERCCA